MPSTLASKENITENLIHGQNFGPKNLTKTGNTLQNLLFKQERPLKKLNSMSGLPLPWESIFTYGLSQIS